MHKETVKELKIYFSVLFYIIIFNAIMISSTIVFHELGHFVIGSSISCQGMQIVLLDQSFNTYTKMNCPPEIPDYFIYALMLGGFLIVAPFAFLLSLFKGYERHYSLIVIGFNSLISSSDLSIFPKIYSYLFMIFGVIVVMYGEALLISRYLLFVERMRVMILSYSNK